MNQEKNSQTEPEKTASEAVQDNVPPVLVTIPAVDFEKLEKESAEYKDKYLRLLAEMENTRKRLQKERSELIQYAIENVMLDFLAPIDQLETALSFTNQMSDEVKHWAFGFQMILKQFKDVLAANGVSAFTSEGTIFDPNHHEAIEMVLTKDHPHGTVVTESSKGYKMAGKTIRPARVTVAKTPEESNDKK